MIDFSKNQTSEQNVVEGEHWPNFPPVSQSPPPNASQQVQGVKGGVAAYVSPLIRAETKEAALKEELKENEKNLHKFSDLIKKSNNKLIKISAVFPFDLFPDEVIVDENKVNIICRVFFWSEDVHSIAIKSIKDISIETNIFFATLKIVPDGYPGDPLVVKFLKKGEAIKTRRIIQGLIASAKEELDPARLPQQKSVEILEELGKASSVD